MDFPFIAYLLNSNYKTLAKFNPTFLQDNFFPILPKYWQVSMYIAMLSEFSFPKKRKQNKSNFRMVNLCNSGTKDFVELWKIIHWNIWMQLSYFIMVKPVQKTTFVKLPMLSSPKQIPVQSLLSNMTSNQFFWLPNEKNLHKTTAKLYPAKECEKNIRNSA